jgi:hypothetical protein
MSSRPSNTPRLKWRTHTERTYHARRIRARQREQATCVHKWVRISQGTVCLHCRKLSQSLRFN